LVATEPTSAADLAVGRHACDGVLQSADRLVDRAGSIAADHDRAMHDVSQDLGGELPVPCIDLVDGFHGAQQVDLGPEHDSGARRGRARRQGQAGAVERHDQGIDRVGGPRLARGRASDIGSRHATTFAPPGQVSNPPNAWLSVGPAVHAST
jgi:hypothetical protein